MILSDWGADVIKVEAPGVSRGGFGGLAGIKSASAYQDGPMAYMDNRGKRSVALDLKTQEGKDAMEKLLATGHIYLSNFRNKALTGLGLAPEQVLERHPHLVCCIMTGYGRQGPAADKPGYEGSGFWARSSAAWQHTSFADGAEYPPLVAPGFGDHTTSLASRNKSKKQ